ncbi:MAG: Gfo/Idh/MocA family oxidoreductase [Lentisphaerae bacterium]|nr:Gfo/Idh/MocA family oxidoreductase [Lentisphaerota bacterium]
MRTIRWGIIGCGDVTEVKSGPAFQQAPGSALVAVMRRTAARAEDYARRHGVPRWYTDADALIADPDVDAVYVATPPGSHLEHARRVCRAGKPCYVEKPMARHAPEARAMVEAFRIAGVPLFVAYYRRALPRFRALKEIIASGRLGALSGVAFILARARREPAAPGWRLDPAISGGGLFLDMGCHVLDLIDYLAGPVDVTQSTVCHAGSPWLAEDRVQMDFRTTAEVPGRGECDFAAGADADELVFRGAAGRASVAVFGDGPVRLETVSGCEDVHVPHPEHVQQPLIASIVAQLLGGEACPSTGESALRTTQVMDRVLTAYYGGRDDAFWERPASWPGAAGGAVMWSADRGGDRG